MRYATLILIASISTLPVGVSAEPEYPEANPKLVAREMANHLCLRALNDFTKNVLAFMAGGGGKEEVVRENTRETVDGLPDAKYTLAIIETIFARDAAAYRAAAEVFAEKCTESMAPHFE